MRKEIDPVTKSQFTESDLSKEVLHLDREWERERERYLVTSRYGRRIVLTRAMSVLSGSLLLMIGVAMIFVDLNSKGPNIIVVFGSLCILLGVGLSIRWFVIAG